MSEQHMTYFIYVLNRQPSIKKEDHWIPEELYSYDSNPLSHQVQSLNSRCNRWISLRKEKRKKKSQPCDKWQKNISCSRSNEKARPSFGLTSPPTSRRPNEQNPIRNRAERTVCCWGAVVWSNRCSLSPLTFHHRQHLITVPLSWLPTLSSLPISNNNAHQEHKASHWVWSSLKIKY